MRTWTRRRALAAGLGAITATSGCLSESSDGSQSPEQTPAADILPTPVAGDPNAAVTVAVYEDYACPHCRTFSERVYPEIESAYIAPGSIRYEFHDFPIPVDETVSWQAASAARAVQDQVGDVAFFTYSKRLFANQDRLGPDVYASLTEGLDVAGETVTRAATEQQYRATVAADRDAAIDAGIEGTPTVLVDGQPVQWNEIAFEPVKRAIDGAMSL